MMSAAERQTIEIREIESIAEIRAVEDLQIEVWGDDERDVVPLNQLVAARHVGGSLIGAFDRERMVGFAYGFLGHLNGSVVHHSHMLAVLPSYRRHNVAFRLKLAQRSKVAEDGVTDRITWTFDPLQSLNAHLNFTKLGVVSDKYKINVYGEEGASFLHRNGTDRFFVTWLINSKRVETRVAANAAAVKAERFPEPVLYRSDAGKPERHRDRKELFDSGSISIEIPADINSIERADLESARRWREETRYVFTEAFAAGFVATEYFLKNEQTGNYILERKRLEDIS